jgi:hypothetical protein
MAGLGFGKTFAVVDAVVMAAAGEEPLTTIGGLVE